MITKLIVMQPAMSFFRSVIESKWGLYLVLKIEDQSDSGTHKGKLRNCSLTFADAEVLQLLDDMTA